MVAYTWKNESIIDTLNAIQHGKEHKEEVFPRVALRRRLISHELTEEENENSTRH